MNRQQMHEYARFGAQSRLAAIDAEREELLASFPELRGGSRQDSGAAVPPQKRGGMSPAERKAVGTRMRAYWAKRRAEKAGEQPSRADRATRPSAAAKRTSKRTGMSAENRKAAGQRMRAYWAARRAEKQAGGRKRAGRKAGRKK
jgi:hypothetical protein